MSLQQRLSLSIVALILALTVSVSGVYLRHLLRMQLNFAYKQAKMVAQQAESATIESISEPPPPNASFEQSLEYFRSVIIDDDQLHEILLRSLGSFESLAEIAVTDEKGRVLSGTTQRQQWHSRPSFEDLVNQGFIQQLRAVYAPPHDYEISRTLAYENRPVLVIHIAAVTTILRRDLEAPVRELGFVALACILTSLLLSVAFSRIAFRPLGRLGEAIDRMTRGEFAPSLPAAASGHDEYAAIGSKLSILGQQFRDARAGISSLRGNMEQLLRKLEGAILLFDRDDRLIIASAAAEHFLGRGRWQVMGQTLDEVFPAGNKLGALVASAVRLRQPIENRVVELEGEPAKVLLTIELMEDFSTRERLGAMVLLRDAETRSEVATQVEISTRLAAISRITGGVAHHIKNPLNSIALHLELLKNRLAGAQVEAPKELEVIAREIGRLDHVVKTFLDFTRPVTLRLTEVRLDRLIEEVASLANPEAAQHQVRIQVLNGCPDGTVRADADQLKEAVLNLVVNGIQAMPQGGELKLGLAKVGSEVELSVADQGVGIPPENREKIFRLYFTTKQKGSGIGLATTFRVVQLHNGTIDFSSEVGRGTTFRVRLPAVEAR